MYVSKFSNAVKKSFTVSDPRKLPDKYIQEHLELVRKYDIDFLLPIWEDVLYFSQVKEQFLPRCEVFCDNFQTLYKLHHKWHFMQMLEKWGIPTPPSFLVRNPEEVKNVDIDKPFALKPCLSRASQNVYKIDDKNEPIDISVNCGDWIAQEWLRGDKYCTLSVCHEGNLSAHSVYPVTFSIDKSSCLSFVSVEHKKIYEWVKDFVKKANFTGLIAFDFIELEDGRLYPIECNPRGTSGLHLFASTPEFPSALFKSPSNCLFPKEQKKRQIAVGMLMYGWRVKGQHFLKEFLSSKDVLFSVKDPLPSLLEPFLLLQVLLLALRQKKNLPAFYTHDLDWEPGISDATDVPVENPLVDQPKSFV